MKRAWSREQRAEGKEQLAAASCRVVAESEA